MNLLTTREADIVKHALRVAGERFRENAKVIREAGNQGQFTDRAVAELAGLFDGYQDACGKLATKLEERAEYSNGVIDLPVTREQLDILIGALDLLNPKSDATRADVHILIAQLREHQ